MKSFLELAKDRYSCRSYSTAEVSKDLVLKVIETARIAPSAKNSQPWKFIVASKTPLREQIAGCYNASWINTAPVIIVACGDNSVSWKRSDGKDHCDIDLAIAIDHITLAATDNNLATCWVCKFDVIKCAELLKLPANIYPVALIPLGYPLEQNNYSERHIVRKEIKDIVSWEGYNF